MTCKIIIFLFLILSLTACSKSKKKDPSGVYCGQNAIHGQYIVHWNTNNFSVIETEDVDKWIEENDQHIKLVEPNYRIPPAQIIQSDNIALPSSNFDFNEFIDSPYAWNLGYYGQNVKVAVVDTGVDRSHPYMKNGFSKNSKEYKGSKLTDDDSNGYVDDIYGWNFISGDNIVTDETGHGTLMSLIITGTHDGFFRSVAPQSKIIPVDFMDERGGTEALAVKAVEYAISTGAKVINNSWTVNCSVLLVNSNSTWENNGALIVNSAGNVPVDVVATNTFPSSLDLMNIINVGSVTLEGTKSTFGGYGSTIRIYTPGENITVPASSPPYDRYTTLSGTSISAAIMSGVAALVWSAYPKLTSHQLRQILISSAKLKNNAPVANVHKAFEIAKQIKN